MRVAACALVFASVGLRAVDAEACSCNVSKWVYAADQIDVPPDPTLYILVRELDAPAQPSMTFTATLDGAPVTLDQTRVLDGARYDAYRLQVHARAPGKLEVMPPPGADEMGFQYTVVTDPPPPASTVVMTTWKQLPMDSCDWGGVEVRLAGPTPAAYRVRWKLHDGTAREAYVLPGIVDQDDGGPPRQLDRHALRLGLGYCTPWWLDPARDLVDAVGDIASARWDGVEVVRLDLDGTEHVVAHGTLAVDALEGVMPVFDPPAPAPAPPPAAPVPAVATTAWWRVGFGVGGGLTLGAVGAWLAFGRRRRRPT